jgi:hypothetical protein
MDDIREWLNKPFHYESGASLYLKHGKDPALKRVFMEPASPFKKTKLIESLRALLGKKIEVETHVATTKENALQTVSNERKWPENRDAVLEALHLQWKPLFAEMMHLCSTIYDIALAGKTDSAKKRDAGVMAHRILDLEEECGSIYAKRDYYLQHTKLPEEKKPMELVVDPNKIPLALSNARRYVNDYKNKVKNNPSDLNAVEQLKKWEWALGEYKRILNIE